MKHTKNMLMGLAFEQKDFFPVQKKLADGALKKITEEENFENYFTAAQMCEEYGHDDRAFGNYKKSAQQQRDRAHLAYRAVEKDPENTTKALSKFSDASHFYDTAALSCEGALRTLPKEKQNDDMRNKIGNGTLKMWRMKGNMQLKMMEYAYRIYQQKNDDALRYPEEQQSLLREKYARELDSIHQKCLQTIINAFTAALPHCENPQDKKALQKRIETYRKMLGSSFEETLASRAA